MVKPGMTLIKYQYQEMDIGLQYVHSSVAILSQVELPVTTTAIEMQSCSITTKSAAVDMYQFKWSVETLPAFKSLYRIPPFIM